MMGFKPSNRIWKKVNAAVLGENAAEALVTIISGMCQMIIIAGVCTTEKQARVHLAAMLLSPDDGPVGALARDLPDEFKKLDDGKWRH